jgi:kynureninase
MPLPHACSRAEPLGLDEREHHPDQMNPRDSFTPAPGQIYLDTATYGLAPTATVDAIHRATERWAAGTADWIKEWDRPAETCRDARVTAAV